MGTTTGARTRRTTEEDPEGIDQIAAIDALFDKFRTDPKEDPTLDAELAAIPHGVRTSVKADLARTTLALSAKETELKRALERIAALDALLADKTRALKAADRSLEELQAQLGRGSSELAETRAAKEDPKLKAEIARLQEQLEHEVANSKTILDSLIKLVGEAMDALAQRPKEEQAEEEASEWVPPKVVTLLRKGLLEKIDIAVRKIKDLTTEVARLKAELAAAKKAPAAIPASTTPSILAKVHPGTSITFQQIRTHLSAIAEKGLTPDNPATTTTLVQIMIELEAVISAPGTDEKQRVLCVLLREILSTAIAQTRGSQIDPDLLQKIRTILIDSEVYNAIEKARSEFLTTIVGLLKNRYLPKAQTPSPPAQKLPAKAALSGSRFPSERGPKRPHREHEEPVLDGGIAESGGRRHEASISSVRVVDGEVRLPGNGAPGIADLEEVILDLPQGSGKDYSTGEHPRRGGESAASGRSRGEDEDEDGDGEKDGDEDEDGKKKLASMQEFREAIKEWAEVYLAPKESTKLLTKQDLVTAKEALGEFETEIEAIENRFRGIRAILDHAIMSAREGRHIHPITLRNLANIDPLFSLTIIRLRQRYQTAHPSEGDPLSSDRPQGPGPSESARDPHRQTPPGTRPTGAPAGALVARKPTRPPGSVNISNTAEFRTAVLRLAQQHLREHGEGPTKTRHLEALRKAIETQVFPTSSVTEGQKKRYLDVVATAITRTQSLPRNPAKPHEEPEVPRNIVDQLVNY